MVLPPEQHDASLLRLERSVTGIRRCRSLLRYPVIGGCGACVHYRASWRTGAIILFQDNELLDHEGPPGGKPGIEEVCRLHYRAPTEGGISGSPVFNSRLWQVIALHHMGGTIGVRKLNGKEGTYGANQGVSIQSIAAAIKGWRAAKDRLVWFLSFTPGSFRHLF